MKYTVKISLAQIISLTCTKTEKKQQANRVKLAAHKLQNLRNIVIFPSIQRHSYTNAGLDNRGFSDSAPVNCLLGLDDDAAIIQANSADSGRDEKGLKPGRTSFLSPIHQCTR
ncbi:hypothetical protein CDL15_Pgr012977 [Punica granatum]|uniref:Uncharacterized protein n=1 Tax=Punica granatum TaxID=22663 RepID=A0A218XFJ9_PUNGR|nr:hypothetical protein CDL15_Pgr012977 [Punica granatum]